MIGDCTPLPPPVAWSLARSLRTLLPLPDHMFSCSLARSFVRFLIIMDSYTQSFARSLDCSIARSLAHILARSYTRSLTHILARSIAHRLLARSHTRSLIYSLARSYILARSIAHLSLLVHTLAGSYTRSLDCLPLARSLTYLLAHIFARSLMHSLDCSTLARSLICSLARMLIRLLPILARSIACFLSHSYTHSHSLARSIARLFARSLNCLHLAFSYTESLDCLIAKFLNHPYTRPLACSLNCLPIARSFSHSVTRSLHCFPLAHSYMIGDCTPLPPR